MAKKNPISQRQALRMRKENKAMSAALANVFCDHPGQPLMSYDMETYDYRSDLLGTVRTARKMGAQVVAFVEIVNGRVSMRLRYIQKPVTR